MSSEYFDNFLAVPLFRISITSYQSFVNKTLEDQGAKSEKNQIDRSRTSRETKVPPRSMRRALMPKRQIEVKNLFRRIKIKENYTLKFPTGLNYG